jgi:hypothetical protein
MRIRNGGINDRRTRTATERRRHARYDELRSEFQRKEVDWRAAFERKEHEVRRVGVEREALRVRLEQLCGVRQATDRRRHRNNARAGDAETRPERDGRRPRRIGAGQRKTRGRTAESRDRSRRARERTAQREDAPRASDETVQLAAQREHVAQRQAQRLVGERRQRGHVNSRQGVAKVTGRAPPAAASSSSASASTSKASSRSRQQTTSARRVESENERATRKRTCIRNILRLTTA